MQNVRSLARRESALAILLGASIAGAGASMGREERRGASFGADFGYGGNTGYGSNPHFGADAPTPQNQLAAWHAQQAGKGRESMLYPNADSTAKIQKYVFAVNQTLTQQLAAAIQCQQNPQTQIRPQRLTCNAPAEGFGTLAQIQLANVNVIVGGVCDMFDFSARAMDATMDLPTLSPANAVIATGAYSGFLAPGYVPGVPFVWALSLKGPSNMVA